jgi:hypothetical protein
VARAIARSGLPSLRGSVIDVPSLLVPYLTAPLWLISDVSRAYHLVLALGGISFSAAVFPAYLLARRIGISPNGGLIVALLSVLVPDAAFATCALTEAYAYPLFLLTLLAVGDAVASPTRRRQLVAIGLMAALCLTRLQFLVIPLVYVISVLVREGSWRRVVRAHPAVVGSVVLAGIGAFAAARGFYSGVGAHSAAVFSIGPWLALDVFVLAIAAGWALVPGALVGFGRLLRSPDPWKRTFGVLSTTTIALIVFEAAYYDAILPRVHERYTFYAVPLLAAAFVYAVQTVPPRRSYVLIAYGMAVAAIVLPGTNSFQGADPSQAPSLLALQTFGAGGARLIWAIPLSLIAITVAQAHRVRWVPLVISVVIAGVLCIAGTRALLGYSPVAHPGGTRNVDLYQLGAPSGSALVTWAGTDRYVLMKTLFWTPALTRVLVLGGGPATDGFGSQPVTFGRHGFVDASGRPVAGPFAFDLQTTVFSKDSTHVKWVDRSPTALALGLNRKSGDLSTATQFLLAPARRVRTMSLVVRSDSGKKQLTFACPGNKFRVVVGRVEVPVLMRIPPSAGVQRCRVSLTGGAAVDRDGSVVSGVRVARLDLEPMTAG